MEAAKINVGVRVRPAALHESGNDSHPVVVHVRGKIAEADGNAFSVDTTFDVNATNKDVYEALVQPLVYQAMQGHNIVVIGYGASGTGKEHTLYSVGEDDGIMFRAAADLFDHIRLSVDRTFLTTMSMYSLYKEVPTDLLIPDPTKQCDLANHRSLGATVTNLAEFVVSDARQVALYARQCLRVKSILDRQHMDLGCHIVTDISVESCSRQAGRQRPCRLSLLRFVKTVGSGGLATSADKGLSTLGIIAEALQGQPPPQHQHLQLDHIPFNDSALTRLLQTALCGNSFASVICTVSPTTQADSIRTMSIAGKLSLIYNRPRANISAVGNTLELLRVEINAIRARMDLNKPGELVDDIDDGLMQAMSQKIAELNQVKGRSWMEVQARSLRLIDERKRVHEQQNMFGVLEELVAADPDLLKRLAKERDVFVRMSLTVNRARQDFAHLEAHAPPTSPDRLAERRIDLDQQLLKLDKIQGNFYGLVELVVEEEERQRALYATPSDMDKFHSLADDYDIADMHNLKLADQKFIKTKSKIDGEFKARRQAAMSLNKGMEAEKIECAAIERELNLTEQLESVKWERDDLLARLLEREARHRVQNARAQHDMLSVFRDYRHTLDQRMRKMDAMYRKLLDESVHDVLRLQADKNTLERRLRSMG